MRIRQALGFAALLCAAMIVLAALLRVDAPDQARTVAFEAARSLGLDLSSFHGPSRTGSSLIGTESLHWERDEGGMPVERVSYLHSDSRLCWSVLSASSWKDNGCISTRRYER